VPGRRKSNFGSVRKLPSGRWQARYEHEGLTHPAPHTFPSKADANAWLAEVQTDQRRGVWIDPKAGQVSLRQYVESWIEARPDIRASTRAKYRYLLDQHILPALGDIDMAALQPTDVRGWWARLSSELPSTAAGAYRLLATICNTAVTDQVIMRSPCRVRGGGREKSPERPTASVPEVTAAIESVPEQFRLALMLAAWCQLRRGEILGLQRRDVDELHGQLKIERAFVVHQDGTHVIAPPKTKASRRTIAIPGNVAPLVVEHLEMHVGRKPDAWLFPGESGQPITPRTLNRAWVMARKAAGRPDLHLHDLRHSGLTWSAAAGATTAELMHRAGHASPIAALRYQHATADRDRALADALAEMSKVVPFNGPAKADGSRRAGPATTS
jgi:integrase